MKARVMQPGRPMPVSFHPQRSELGRANGARAEGGEVVGERSTCGVKK